jgi:misacylated tRNA(Ala) deacylase
MTFPPTLRLYLEEPYLSQAEARVQFVARECVVLDRTIFYPQGGGQRFDTGYLERADGSRLTVTAADNVADRQSVALEICPDDEPLPEVGETVVQHLDWETRYRYMRIHTALHLLSVVLPYPVTGGQIGADEGRLDFDMPDGGIDRAGVTEALMAHVRADHAVTTEWISDDDLAANPAMVKTMKVKPPTGSGRVRLVRIGEDLDLQPCGGTHVRSTGEIGEIHVGKVEKKGRINRRVRIRFGPLPAVDA